ncbi:hypothetical protein EC80586_4183, partial [Escherichia coli 8.0586]|jgi:hypothetical protein
MSLF